MRSIGVLEGFAESNREGQERTAAFREGLKQLGWIEGRNIRIDIRWAAPGDTELISRLAKELIALQPELILSSSTPTTAALLNETRSIPIVFANISDPLGSGFVAGYPRPGGNVTGFTNMEPTMAGKWLGSGMIASVARSGGNVTGVFFDFQNFAAKWIELLKEISPQLSRLAVLWNPDAGWLIT